MIGTSVIIAVIEEFFYRGFAYRWMQGSPFFEMDAGRLHWGLLAIISIFFAVSHIEWGAAFMWISLWIPIYKNKRYLGCDNSTWNY